MNDNVPFKSIFAEIPSVHEVLNFQEIIQLTSNYGQPIVTDAIRESQNEVRELLKINGEQSLEELSKNAFIERIKNKLMHLVEGTLCPVINLTGTVLHTNLGRALLPKEAIKVISEVAGLSSNLEYDLNKGIRRDREKHIEEKLCYLTGAEAATIVNNNAAAVLLTLNTFSRRKEVLVSRGELIEIGGSFKLPDIMMSAGCKLKEVGTTNRTHLFDYEQAFSSRTGMIFKAHSSNFKIEGYTAVVKEQDLANFSKKVDIPFIVDLGSGSLISLTDFGLAHEPTPAETIARGVDLVTFSGDKLLGGPQCGIIVGSRELINKIKKNPMKRALRCDKMTIAAFSVILSIYLKPKKALNDIPTLRLLKREENDIKKMAQRLYPKIAYKLAKIATVEMIPCKSQVGSGALPVDLLPSYGLAIRSKLSKRQNGIFLKNFCNSLRSLPIPVIGRVHEGALILDLRCLEDEEILIKQLQFLKIDEFKG